MCNESASWNLSIVQVGSNAYSVEVSRRDKKSSDKIVREFDNFGTALEFASLTYEDLN